MCPVSRSDGADGFGLSEEFVPGVAAGLDYRVVVLKDAIGEPVLTEVLPDVFDRIELG